MRKSRPSKRDFLSLTLSLSLCLLHLSLALPLQAVAYASDDASSASLWLNAICFLASPVTRKTKTLRAGVVAESSGQKEDQKICKKHCESLEPSSTAATFTLKHGFSSPMRKNKCNMFRSCSAMFGRSPQLLFCGLLIQMFCGVRLQPSTAHLLQAAAPQQVKTRCWGRMYHTLVASLLLVVRPGAPSSTRCLHLTSCDLVFLQ